MKSNLITNSSSSLPVREVHLIVVVKPKLGYSDFIRCAWIFDRTSDAQRRLRELEQVFVNDANKTVILVNEPN